MFGFTPFYGTVLYSFRQGNEAEPGEKYLWLQSHLLFKQVYLAVLRIRDILVRIRIRGSVPLTSDPDIFVIDLQDAQKKFVYSFLLITF